MKRFLILMICVVISIAAFGQSPQSFQYQSVVRDVSGVALVNQPVSFQISIIEGTLPGTSVYVETHSATTNDFGIVTLSVGNGTPVTNLFSDIDWSITPHYIKIEADLGSGYLDMGTTQLLSVPYALYSENAGNIPVYTGGSGIDVTGTTITNTSPDQTLNLIQGGATTITGTYPNYEISSTDLNTGTPGGQNTSVQYNNSGVFAGDTASLAWDYTNQRLGVGISNPLGRVVIKGSNTASDTLPLFEVKNKLGQPVFIVYPDSVHFYIKDDASPSNRGGFAVSGRSNAKAGFNDYLKVRPDSTRIYTGDTITGFGVKNIGSTSKTSYMQLTPKNYLIGHMAGNSITTGKYNSFIGYQAGYSDTSGNNNYFIGYRSGYSTLSGYSNVFLGDNSGYSNTIGSENVFLGDSCGYTSTAGNYNVFLGKNSGFMNNSSNNVFLGYESGKQNSLGSNNAFMGYQAGLSNTIGLNNVFIGNLSGYSNINGNYNVFLGNEAGYSNTIGLANVYLGENAGYSCQSGSQNVFLGNLAGTNFLTGNNNVFLGNEVAKSFTSGQQNVIIGNQAGGMGSTGDFNVFVGHQSGYKNNGGKKNVYLGHTAGYNNTTGENNIAIGEAAHYNNMQGLYNVAIGFEAGWASVSASNCTYLGAGAGRNNVGISNTFIGNSAGQSNINGMNNVALGLFAGMYSTGSNNVFIGNGAGTGSFIGPTGPGSGNVFIGYGSGQNETGSNKLYIANTSTANPLILGDFSTGVVTINSVLKLTPGVAPALPTEGMIYSNSTDHHLYFYNGSSWRQLDN